MSNVTTVPIEIVDKATGHVSIMHFVTKELSDKKLGDFMKPDEVQAVFDALNQGKAATIDGKFFADKNPQTVSTAEKMLAIMDLPVTRWSREASDELIWSELVKSGQKAEEISWRIITPEDVPASRDFRHCWRSNGAKIAVDMPLARDEHMANIRRRRDAALVAKDAEWLKEFSRGNQAGANAIEAERQVLRDVPQVIDATVKAAATPDALKAVWPATLDGAQPPSLARRGP